jgi:hypothetical protein
MALSVGFIRFVSSPDATQATGLPTLAPVGLTPTEHASLCWTYWFAKTPQAGKVLIIQPVPSTLQPMIETLRWLGILIRAALRERRDLALENLALRQQLGVLKRRKGVPRLKRKDRLFWVVLSRIWAPWRQALHLVNGDTVVGWQRMGFRVYWARISRRKFGGRPQAHSEVRALIKRMATANPFWGAPRIHGELLKLGIEISERTVSRLMPKHRNPPSQTWKAFWLQELTFL